MYYRAVAVFQNLPKELASESSRKKFENDMATLYIPIQSDYNSGFLLCHSKISKALSFEGDKGIASFGESCFYMIRDVEIPQHQRSFLMTMPSKIIEKAHILTDDNYAFRSNILEKLSCSGTLRDPQLQLYISLGIKMVKYKGSQGERPLLDVKIEKVN